MPELPEVEVTARALAQRLAGRRVDGLRVHNPQLRWPVSPNLAASVRSQPIGQIDRRGKYLLWHLPNGVMISHLGMSGSWRIHEAAQLPARLPHDHIEILCEGVVARFNDPRRFGALLWHPAMGGDVLAHPLLAQLGIEPFDPRFTGDWLFAATRSRGCAIKQLLLSGKVVVGVGNIYATECLYDARIHPETPAGRIGRARHERLVLAIRQVLMRAIDAGGSTLRDFSGVDGAAGRYTEFANAYGRDGLCCPRCGARIRRMVQGQRASYFCPRCQRR